MQKFVQRKIYDTLSSKNGILTIFVSIVLLCCSAFYFGEAIVEWSSEKYAVVFNSFSDNLLGKSYRTRLCLPVPIDVVYTWVNGTDPLLLSELRRTKAELEHHSNSSDDKRKPITGCPYANCVKLPMVVFPTELPKDITRSDLERKSLEYQSLVRLEHLSSDDLRVNLTLAHLLTKQDAERAANTTIIIDGKKYKAQQAYLTSDITIPKSKLQQTTILVSGFKKEYSSEEVMKLVPKHVMEHVFDVEMVGRVGVFKTSTSGEADILLGFAYNFTLDGRYLQFNKANLVYDLTFSGTNERDLSASRFEDNEELRYSLRSLEQYAPWVRHVYIVTNGQIPYWLNLDNSRITVVTHEEIFPNKSHLPTFSSPAIESHLHRIPGLSDKFLYLNDDVMFGAQVWPDDFYTHSQGQKVYLSWSIPDCAPGCPQSWIKDGYCDRACNVSECSYDAGDCAGGVPAFNAGSNWGQQWMHADSSEPVSCAQGCSNPWIADRYCDVACNVHECGFDAGDCGVANFHLMHRISMSMDKRNYTIPSGVSEAYLNFTSISSLKVTEASYESKPSLRVAAVSNKYRTLTVVLLSKHNTTSFGVNMTFGEGDDKFKFSFNVHAVEGTTALSRVYNTTTTDGHARSKENVRVTEQPFVFHAIEPDARGPQVVLPDDAIVAPRAGDRESQLSEDHLSEQGRIEMDNLRRQLLEGDITQKGFDKRKEKILQKYYESEQTKDRRDVGEAGDVGDSKQHRDSIGEEKGKRVDNGQPNQGLAGVKNSQAQQKQFPAQGQPQDQQRKPQGQQGNPQIHQVKPLVQKVKLQDQQRKPQDQQGKPQVQDGKPQIQDVELQVQDGQPQVQDEKPLVQDRQPQVQDGQPQVQDRQPQVQDGQPQVQDRQPQVQDRQPQVQDRQPQVQDRQPQVQDEKPQVQDRQPQVQDEKPQVQDGQPQVQDEKPQVQDRKPQVQDGKPQVQDGKPQVQDGKPQVQDRQPQVQDGQLQVQDGKPQVQDRQPPVQDGKPQVQDGKPQVQDGKPQVQDRQPHVQDGKPQVQDGQPQVQDGKPQVQDRQPQVQDRQPQVQDRQPQVQDGKPQVQDEKLELQGGPEVDESRKGRQLQQYVEQEQELGFLPWERRVEFKQLVQKRSAEERKAEFSNVVGRQSRHLLDTFGQSLHHVNDLYNKMFGVKARKVPGHIAHMIDREVMEDLYTTFHEQWEATSSHKIRSGSDMQYAFSYFYFLMDSKRNNTASDFIEEMDIDNSGVLSDREIRTMATRIFDTPLDLLSLTSLEQHIINCSTHLPSSVQRGETTLPVQEEKYYDRNMPQVTLPLLKNCGPVLSLITRKVQPKTKYKYEVLGDQDIHFKMIGTNLSTVVGQLDDLRRHPRKFICLNDNIDHSNSEALQVKALLADFYEGLFPIRSQFELPPDYRNRFLYTDQLREWKQTRDYLKLAIELLLVLLVLYTIYSFYEDQIKLRLEQRRRPSPGEHV